MTDQSLAGKTVVITGANTGIGRANVLALAERKPARIVIAARSRERTEPVIEAVSSANPDGAVDFVEIDLTSLASVRKAADRILDKDLPIDALINTPASLGSEVRQPTDSSSRGAPTTGLGEALPRLRGLQPEPSRIVRRAAS